MEEKDIQEAVRRIKTKIDQAPPEVLKQYLVLEIDHEEYAVDINELQEIIKLPDITPIPNAPEFIAGILNLRGKIVVVIDLEKRFHLPAHSVKPEHIVITESNGNTFGVMVDRVKEVIMLPISTVRPTPGVIASKIHADYLKGEAVLGKPGAERLLIILDLPKLLQEKELMKAGQVIRETQ